MSPTKTPLPIDASLGHFRELLARHSRIVVEASPGAGKTTRIPPEILRQLSVSSPKNSKVYVLQPRRIATRLLADRIASENAWRVGDEIGYAMRFESKRSRDTQLVIMTEGTLLRELQSNPDLSGVGAIVLDEFHERSLNIDLALAMLTEIQDVLRPDLKLIVMSATLDSMALISHLEKSAASGVGHLKVDLPPHALSSEHLSHPLPPYGHTKWLSSLIESITTGLENLLPKLIAHNHHALVFLPGQFEIQRTMEASAQVAKKFRCEMLALHGQLSTDEQAHVLAPSTKTKVIFTTNIAETSLTIDGVRAVIDSGWIRRTRFDDELDVDSLVTERISLASATQRAGRAARQGPGTVLRLWTRQDEVRMEAQSPSEISRTDLGETLLFLASQGVATPESLAWFEAPPTKRLLGAKNLLTALGAISQEGRILELGERLSRYPLSPRLARLADQGKDNTPLRRELLDLVISLAGESNPFRQRQLRDQLDRIPATTAVGNITAAILRSFPDRVARLRDIQVSQRGDKRYVMVGGRDLTLADPKLLHGPTLLIALELRHFDRGSGKDDVRIVTAHSIEQKDLELYFPNDFRKALRTEWNQSEKKAFTQRALCYRDLSLEPWQPAQLDQTEAERLLARSLLKDFELWIQADPEILGLWKRLRLVETLLGLDVSTSLRSLDCLEEIAMGARAWADLTPPHVEGIWSQRIEKMLPRFRQLAPSHFTLPRGRTVAIDYDVDHREAVVAAKIQDCFGLKNNIFLIDGRLPLTFELLGPHGRPLQKTKDLAGFWTKSYLEIRKELRARYPKQKWPENPHSTESD